MSAPQTVVRKGMTRPRNRLNVALETETHELLRRLAQQQRRSMCQQLTVLVIEAASQAGIEHTPHGGQEVAEHA